MPSTLIPPEAMPSVIGSLGVTVLVLVVMLLRLWRGSQEPDELVHDVVPVEPMPGVRVFDVPESGTPLDVTNSRVEPRAVRDARQRALVDHPAGTGG